MLAQCLNLVPEHLQHNHEPGQDFYASGRLRAYPSPDVKGEL